MGADEIGHRWIRGRAVLDILLPDGTGGAEKRKNINGTRTIEAAGTTQAPHRAQLAEVELSDGTRGRVSRPSLLGAIIAKCAAASADTGPRGRERHLTDVAFLCSLVTDLRGMRAEVLKERKDRQRVTRVLRWLRHDHPAWLDQPDPQLALLRLQTLGRPPQE